MKQMTKQLIMVATVLLSVTVLSFGIRQVRLSAHRARNAASAGAVRGSAPASKAGASGQRSVDMHADDRAAPEQDLYALAEQDYQDGDRDPFDGAADTQHAADSDPAVASADHSNAYEHSGKHADVVSMDKSFKADYSKFKADYAKSKGDYAKSTGSKGLQKTSLGEYENLYITDNGEHWYVTQHPDRTTTKTQLQEIDGQLQPVRKANVYPSKGGQAKSEAPQSK